MYMIDWMMFIAATVSDNTVRDGLISNLHDYASSNLENQPFEVVCPNCKHIRENKISIPVKVILLM